MDEQPVWKGSASHVKYLGTYILCALTFFLIVPIVIAVRRWIDVHFTIYELTSERLRTTTGMLTKRTEQLELYRVKDYSLVQPFRYRVFGVGNIVLVTSDRTTPHVVLEAIPNAAAVHEHIRTYVEQCRRARGVREVDFDETEPGKQA